MLLYDYIKCSFLWAAEDWTDLVAVAWSLLCSADRDFKCRVQSRELEGRSCHVSLFAREPSSLQRSTTLSPCTLFSPYSGPSPDDHNATADGDTRPLLPIFFCWTTKPSFLLSHLLLKSGWCPLQTRTTLTSWRTPWTCQPSSGSWTQGSTKSHGSMSRISGWCSIMPGCTTVRRLGSTSTAPSWLRCLSRRSTPLCRALDTAVGGRWGSSVF